MNKFIKFALATAIIAPALMAGVAFASTNVTYLTLNGQPNATIPMGSTVQANVQYDLVSDSTTSDTESLSWQILDGAGNAALPPVCVDISDRTTAGTFNTSFPLGTGGQTEGTWDVRVRLYGTPGTGADNNCAGSYTDSQTFSNVLTLTTPADSSTVTGNPFSGSSNGYCSLYPWTCLNSNNGLTGNNGVNSNPWFGGSSLPVFCAQYPTLCGMPPTTAPPAQTSGNAAKCALITSAMRAAPPYTYSAQGTQLQSAILLDDPYSIPALHPGSTVAMGFFGPQTHMALSSYDGKYGCH